MAASSSAAPALVTAARIGCQVAEVSPSAPASVGNHRLAGCPPDRRSITWSSSPARTAAASAARCPPKRWLARRTTMPSPMPTPGGPRRTAGRAPGRLSPVRRRLSSSTAGHGRPVRPCRRARRRPPPRPAARGRPPGSAGRPARTASVSAGHQRQGHHRGLVDDEDVMGQVVVAVVAEATGAVRAPAQQAVQR